MVEVANGQATKIIVPSELQNLATAGVTFHETAPANNVPKKKHPEADVSAKDFVFVDPNKENPFDRIALQNKARIEFISLLILTARYSLSQPDG